LLVAALRLTLRNSTMPKISASTPSAVTPKPLRGERRGPRRNPGAWVALHRRHRRRNETVRNHESSSISWLAGFSVTHQGQCGSNWSKNER
jgi:hypothetical protein